MVASAGLLARAAALSGGRPGPPDRARNDGEPGQPVPPRGHDADREGSQGEEAL